jgi:hypothetical protein
MTMTEEQYLQRTPERIAVLLAATSSTRLPLPAPLPVEICDDQFCFVDEITLARRDPEFERLQRLMMEAPPPEAPSSSVEDATPVAASRITKRRLRRLRGRSRNKNR